MSRHELNKHKHKHVMYDGQEGFWNVLITELLIRVKQLFLNEEKVI
jgi:hypothetical protein